MTYRQRVENKGEKDLAPKRLIFYRGGPRILVHDRLYFLDTYQMAFLKGSLGT